ncbi:MAG: YIP1 family protein [Candidatus Thorarchaeota archaeon]
MRRCSACNSPVPSDATVCPVCGQKIAEEILERVLPFLKRPLAEDVKTLGLVGRIIGVLIRPAATFRDIARRPDGRGPAVVVLFNALIMTAAFLAVCSKLTLNYIVDEEPVAIGLLSSPVAPGVISVGLFTIVPNLILGMLYLTIGAGAAHVILKIAGGTARYGRSMMIVGYSLVPVILARLLGVLILMLTIPEMSVEQYGTTYIVTTVFQSGAFVIIDYLTTASFIWVGFILAFGIREVHNTSTSWAFAISAICTAILILTFWQVH